jgi:hypothetical protein
MNASVSGGNSKVSVLCTESAEGINPVERFPTVIGSVSDEDDESVA